MQRRRCRSGIWRPLWKTYVTALKVSVASKQSPGLRWLKYLEAELILGRVNATSMQYKKDKQVNK